MHQLYLESTLDRLLRTEEGLVKKHALKVLWVLRDHNQAVESAQAAVAELDKVRAIADRYQLSGYQLRGELPDPVQVTITLDIPFDDEAGQVGSAKREALESVVADDLAKASGVPAENFKITKLSAGSVVVDLEIMPDPLGIAPAPSDIARNLETQAADPKSPLMSGKLTSQTKGIQVLYPQPQPLDPLQIRTDASSKFAWRLRKSMTERNLPAKLHASLQWCSESGLLHGYGCAKQEEERKEALRKARVEIHWLEDQANSYKAEIKELRSSVMTAEAALANQIAMALSAVSVEKLMDNLQMITLNLDRDFDKWKPEDARSLADSVAESAGVAKEHVKILNCQRGSVIASTVIMAPDWVAVAAKIKTSLIDESGSLKTMGVVGCAGLMGDVVGKPPRALVDAAATVVPVGRRVKLGASTPVGDTAGCSDAPVGLVKKNTRFVERVVARWTRRDVSTALNAWKVSVSSLRRVSMLGARIVGHWTQLQLSQAYETWHDYANSLTLSRETLRRIALRWQLREMSVAFFSWQDQASKRQRAVRVCSRITKHWIHRSSAAALECWHAHALEQKRTEKVCTRIVQKLLNNSLDVAMMTWKDHARKQQRATTVCARVVSHWQHRCKANAFESWHLHAKEQRRMEDLCSKVLRCRIQKFRKASLWWLYLPRTCLTGVRALTAANGPQAYAQHESLRGVRNVARSREEAGPG